MNWILGTTLGIVLLIGVIGIISYFSISNTEIKLRQKVVAQQQVNKTVFDNTWKIISQQAEVSEQYKESFAKIYPKLMDGRYGNTRGGALMSWIQESNPNFDVSLYSKLMTTIEAQRSIFTMEQKKLIDLGREHTVYISTFPNTIFIGNRGEIKLNIVTSDKTEKSFETGQDNEVRLFE
jgi:hypothetical protein